MRFHAKRRPHERRRSRWRRPHVRRPQHRTRRGVVWASQGPHVAILRGQVHASDGPTLGLAWAEQGPNLGQTWALHGSSIGQAWAVYAPRQLLSACILAEVWRAYLAWKPKDGYGWGVNSWFSMEAASPTLTNQILCCNRRCTPHQ